jgi:hypothetical protein
VRNKLIECGLSAQSADKDHLVWISLIEFKLKECGANKVWIKLRVRINFIKCGLNSSSKVRIRLIECGLN